MSRDLKVWVSKEILVNMGNTSIIQRFDEKMALAAGLTTKSLTSTSIESHLKGFGLDSEQSSHTLIGSLSGGQKVKVVLAASLWLNPHLVILDEPTSSMDGATEERIINNIMSLSYNPTLIISTHRTNHLLRVDKIGVIIDGNLVQYGPRDEIVKQNNPENKG